METYTQDDLAEGPSVDEDDDEQAAEGGGEQESEAVGAVSTS